MGTPRPNFIVGIGGSAGGLNAYKALLDALPSKTGMAFVFVTHMLPDATSELAELLSRRTKMPVTVAADAMPVLANHVYVSPPNVDLRIKDYALKVVSPRSRSNVIVDLFLVSLAEAMGARAIGIILSGFDGDGTEGCRHIKATGGTTFAQDASAQVNGMSRSAQDASCIDYVLAPRQMAVELQRLAKSAKSPLPNRIRRRARGVRPD